MKPTPPFDSIPAPTRKFRNLFDDIEDAIAAAEGSSATSRERDRPYDGQPHTQFGIRGKTLVDGLSMRDVSDCLELAWTASQIPDDPDAGVNPEALAQNLCVEIERMMGIYPNVPRLSDSLEARHGDT